MGVTDETKPSDSSKQKPPLLPKPALSSIRNEAAEASVPQMVITSAEEVAEELKLVEEKENAVVAETVKSEIGQTLEETVVIPTAFHRPLVISGPDASSETETFSKESEQQRISESPPKSAVQRPLIIDDPESLHETSKETCEQIKTSESPTQSAVQRPLVFDLGPSSTLIEGEIREGKKEHEEVQSASQRPLIIKTDGSQQDGISSVASSRVPVSCIDETQHLATAKCDDGTTDTELQITQTHPQLTEGFEDLPESKTDFIKEKESSQKPEGLSLFTFLKHGHVSKGDKSLAQHKELVNEEKDFTNEHHLPTEVGSTECKHKELPKEQRDLKKEFKEFFNFGHTTKEDKSILQPKESLNEQRTINESYAVGETESSECKHKELPKEQRDLKKEIKEFFSLSHTGKEDKIAVQQREPLNIEKASAGEYYSVTEVESSEIKSKELAKEQRDLKKDLKEFFGLGHTTKEDKSAAQQKESADEHYIVGESSGSKPKELPKEQRDLKKEFKEFFSLSHAPKEDKSVVLQKEEAVQKNLTDEHFTVIESESSESKPKELPKEQRDLKKEFKEFFSLSHAPKEDKPVVLQKETAVQKSSTDEHFMVTEAECFESKPKDLPKEQRDLKKEFKEFFSLSHAVKEDKSQQKEIPGVQKSATDEHFTISEAESSETKPKDLSKEQRDLKKEFKEFFSHSHATKEDKFVPQQKETPGAEGNATNEHFSVVEAESSESKPKDLPKEQRDLKKEFKEFFSLSHATKEDKSVVQQKQTLGVQKNSADEQFTVVEAESSESKPKDLPKEQRDLKKEFKEFFSLSHAAKGDKTVAEQKETGVQESSTDEHFTVTEAESSENKDLPKEQRDLKKEFKEFFGFGHGAKEDKIEQKESLNDQKDSKKEQYPVKELEESTKEVSKDLKTEFKEFFKRQRDSKAEFSEEQKDSKETKPSVERKDSVKDKEPLREQKDIVEEKIYRKKHIESEIYTESKEQKSNIEELHPSKETKEKTKASEPESLYETCCIRLAVLIRNKAIDIVSSKTSPPTKPPKPSAETVAKARAAAVAKRVQEYENRPRSFGDDFQTAYDGLRYVDDDTESSTDYKDFEEDMVFIMDPQCYGIMDRVKNESKLDTFSVPSTCSGLTSYYTADAGTLKDENMSDNTLDTVSLGSEDSWVASKPSLMIDTKKEHSPFTVRKDKLKASGHTEKLMPRKEKPIVPEKPKISIEIKPPVSSDEQQTIGKRVPPPVPPKPAVLLKPNKNTSKIFPKPSQSEVAKCVNTLSLSPRPSSRASTGSRGTRKRPLTIAGVKETEFPISLINRTPDTQKKPLLTTVVKNQQLKTIPPLPSVSSDSQKPSPAYLPSSVQTDLLSLQKSKKSPPQRPPPPPNYVKKDVIKNESVASASIVTSSLIYQSNDKDLPPPKPVHKSRPHISPPRPPPPSIKGSVRPPRPPPPARPTSKNVESIDLLTTVSSGDNIEIVENMPSCVSQSDRFVTQAEILPKVDDNLVAENNKYDTDKTSEISSHTQTPGTDSISRPLKFPTEANETTSDVKLQIEAIGSIAQSEQNALVQEESKLTDVDIVEESKLETDKSVLEDTISPDITTLSSLPNAETPLMPSSPPDTVSKSPTVEHTVSDLLSKANVTACDNLQDSVEPQPPPRTSHKKPKPPPRVRRNRSRTVEVVPLTWKPEERRRRSQSLSEMDIKRKTTEQQQLSSEMTPELKVLYTAVSKDPGRSRTKIDNTEIESREKTPEKICSRPLPAPPPPPRSRSKSSSTSRKPANDVPSGMVAKEELCSRIEPDKFLISEEIDKMQPEKQPDNKQSIKPIARKRKEERYRFRSLDSGCKTSIPLSSGSVSEISKIDDKIPEIPILPIKPERKAKIHRELQYDENANVAEPVPDDIKIKTENISQENIKAITSETHFSSDRRRIMHSVSCTDHDNKAPSERETESPSRSQRAKSLTPEQKSRSSWYDESDISGDLGDVDTPPSSHKESLEKLNCSPTGTEKSVDDQQKSRHGKGKSDSLKRPRETSKFYVDVSEQGTDPEVLPSKEDKETSPLPLECSEKSVQTSLETLSHGIKSRSEQSDDTDDLLDLAQTLQDELKVIISRHKKFGEDSKSEGEISDGSNLPSSHTVVTQSKLSPPLSMKKGIKKTPSARSSSSELWHMTSSDESEDEFIDHQQKQTPEEVAYARRKKKVFYIAREIMTSEEVFVDALQLLNVDFKQAVEKASQEKGTSIVPDEVLNQILNHLPQLQRLNENLLMDLKDRIQRWDEVGKIADVIVKIGPFLKLYSWYIQDFESTAVLLEESRRKYPMFCQVIKEFEMSPRCKRLALNHYMLKPVQRIPQYRLLLQEYLHHLSEDSPDYQDTQTALQIVTEVASHANESMKQGDNFQKLFLIQSSILGHKEIIKPGRLFVKEGELMKLSRKGMQPRWFVLLNDLLLYLTPVQQGLYRVNHELSLTGMKVAIPVQQDYQNEFSIISVTRSFTLAAKSQEERQEWIVALTKAIEENASKRSTFTSVRLQQKAQERADNEDEETFVLGKKAPVWIPDSRVTMCQLCTSEFTVTFRRHHCRACGKVICSVCSSNRTALHYLGNRIARVCDECFLKLEQGSGGYTESGETDSDNQQIAVKSHLRTDSKHIKKGKRHMPSVLKEVCANDQGSSISGYLHKKSGKGCRKNWFVVKDKVLYEYRASEDVAALRSVPLLGYMVETFSEPLEGVDPGLLFQLTHPGQAAIVFRAETLGSAERWIQALKEATVLE